MQPATPPQSVPQPVLPPLQPQSELPLDFPVEQKPAQQDFLALPTAAAPKLNWSEHAIRLEKAVSDAGNSAYGMRNALIVKMWADRGPKEGQAAVAKIQRYANVTTSCMKWVLKVARRGEYTRLVKKSGPGKRGKRPELIDALRKGTPPLELVKQFRVHRTTVLRATQQFRVQGNQSASAA